MRKAISIIFMWLLTVANLVTFYYQPSSFSIFNPGGGKWDGLHWLFMLPVVFCYAVLAIVGIILLTKNLHSILTGKESDSFTKATVFALLFSLLAISYGTFLQKQSLEATLHDTKRELSRYQWENENVLIKYGGGKTIVRSRCIWRGDTIIYKYSSSPHIDTLVIDEANNTCHFTYKPMVDYHIEVFRKNNFTQDSANAFFPSKYDERIQYVINQVNNKHEDEFNFYFMEGADDHVRNDSIMCFLFKTSQYDATQRLGYLYFTIRDHVAVLKDSCSDIYRLIDYPKEEGYRVSCWWAHPSEYDLPLLRSCYRKEKMTNNDFIQYGDYIDVLQKKPVIINCPIWIEYWDTTTKSLNYTTTKFECRQNSDGYYDPMQYPVFDYYTEFSASKHSDDPADTLEKGQYFMRDGEYVKEVYYQKK